MKKFPLLFFAAALAVLALDQATKYYIRTHLGHFDVVHILPFLDIVYAENTGSAFGMFRSFGSTFFIIISTAAVAALSILIIKDSHGRTAYALLLGGAAGNLLDRVLYGHVIDFIDIYAGSLHWPAFNIADSALTIGIAILFIKAFFGSCRTH